MKLPPLILATNNAHKVEEIKTLLSDFPCEILCLSDFPEIPQAIEDGESFDENAYKKASHVAKILGLPALADDSGLVVPALNNEPGIFSARYAGEKASDQDNMMKLLHAMEHVTERRAYFQCVISLAVPSGPALTYEGKCEGLILDAPRGTRGFGYDPVFYVKEFNKTFAELEGSQKNLLSHRGRALREMQEEKDKIVRWLQLRLEEEQPEKFH